MKKLLILSNISSKKYGDSTRPYYLGKYLSKYFSTTQVCKTEILENTIKYEKLLEKVSFSRPLSIYKVVREVDKRVKRKDLDILYTHQLLFSVIGALVKVMNPDLSFYTDFHTSAYFELKHEPSKGFKNLVRKAFIPLLEKFVCKKSDSIITVSKETKELLIEYYSVNEQKVYIVKNATDIEVIKKGDGFNNAKLKQYNLNKEKDILAIFPNPRDGFISNELAMDFLLEVANRIKHINANIKMVILGGGNVPKQYPDNVIFTGYVEEYNKWLNTADVCIATYPSNAVCGGVRNKICDYLAVGKPIIATKESMRGFDDLIKDVNYYECNTIESFAEVLAKFDKKKGKINKMILSNFKKREEYSWKNRAEELVNVFNNI